MAWDLVEKRIKSVGTNPGPVHSDRIYKTVYPKAASEFLRIGGFKGLTNKQIENANVLCFLILEKIKKLLKMKQQN